MKPAPRVVIGILLLAVIGASPATAAEGGFVGFMSKLGDAALLRPVGLAYTAISTALYAVPTAPVLAAVDAVSGKDTLASATHHMVKRPFTFVFLERVGEHHVAASVGDGLLLRPAGYAYAAISTALYAVPTAPVLAAVDALSGTNSLTRATHHMVKRPVSFAVLDTVGEHRVAAAVGDVLFVRSTGLVFTVLNGTFFLFPVAPIITVADFSRLGEAADGFVGSPFRTTFKDPIGGPHDS